MNSISVFWPIMLGIANIAVSTGLTIGIFYVGAKTRKIDTMEEQLRSAASQAVDLRFATVSNELTGAARMRNVVADMQRRLERGDGKFEEHSEHQHKLELKTFQMISELREQCASKDDMRRIEQQLGDLRLSIATIGGECN